MATTGNLAEMSIPVIIQSICLEGGTARLMVRSPSGEASIYMQVGEIVHCKFGSLAGQEALYQVLCWQSGIFRLDAGIPAPTQTVQGSWRSHLMQAMVRLDDQLHKEGSPEDKPKPAPGAVPNPPSAPRPVQPPVHRPSPPERAAAAATKPEGGKSETTWVQRIQSVNGVEEVSVVSAEGTPPPYAPPGQSEEEAALVAYIGNAAFQIGEIMALKSLQRIAINIGDTHRLVYKSGEFYLGLRLAARANVQQVVLETNKILEEVRQ